MIFTTAHPITLFLLDETIKKRWPEYKIVKVMALMGQKKHKNLFDDFCNKVSKSQDEYKDYDILLTTTPLIDMGLNITAVNVFIMFNPL